VKANADFTGCNLEEISEFARKQGIEIKNDLTGLSIKTLSFSTSGKATINYSDNTSDVANCDYSRLDKGELDFSWEDKATHGYELSNGNGTAKVQYQDVYCVLSIDSKLDKDSKKYDVSVTFVLKAAD